jgi:hypothetical protein
MFASKRLYQTNHTMPAWYKKEDVNTVARGYQIYV